MVCVRRQRPLPLVCAALLLLLAGRALPQPQSAASPATAAAASPPTNASTSSNSSSNSSSSGAAVNSRLNRVEGKLSTLETSVIKLIGRLRVVSNNLRSILSMLAPILSPVVTPAVTPAVTPVVTQPLVPTSRPASSTARPPPPDACPAGYSRVGDRRSRLCLSGPSPQPLGQRAAAARCRATGGRLLQLESNVKFHLVKSLLTDDRQLWVGATYRAPAKDFFWTSGGQKVQVMVQGLVTRGATCTVLVMFRTAGHLAAMDCRLPRYFMCERVLSPQVSNF